MSQRRGTILFAGPDDAETIVLAKDYIKAQEFTPEDVKIVRRESQVLVESVRTVWEEI